MSKMGLTKKLLHLMKIPQIVVEYKTLNESLIDNSKKDKVKREQKIIDYLKSWCPDLIEDEA
jgi:hypothetical protein